MCLVLLMVPSASAASFSGEVSSLMQHGERDGCKSGIFTPGIVNAAGAAVGATAAATLGAGATAAFMPYAIEHNVSSTETRPCLLCSSCPSCLVV